MSIKAGKFWLGFVVCAATFSWAAAGHAADDRPWRVEKATGEVWVAKSDNQKISLGTDTDLSAGDNIRTGRNGRVLLVRGEERIVISPNSAIGIPVEGKDGFPTTITQQAGSIFLEVEKKNVQHFEVETPYLAAVVKGTQFKVSVDRFGAKVDVVRGQVQVADFKSGDNVLVLPGQAANVKASGQGGLSLTGKGNLNSIEHGTPRVSSVQALVVPKRGLNAPANATKLREVFGRDAKAAFAKATPAKDLASSSANNGARNSVAGSLVSPVKKHRNGMLDFSNQAASENSNSDAGWPNQSGALSAGGVGNAGSVIGNAGGVAGNTGGLAGTAGGAVGNTMTGTGTAVGNVVGGTLGGVGNTVSSVTTGLGTTVSATTNLVGGVLGSTTGVLTGGNNGNSNGKGNGAANGNAYAKGKN